jgi:hypothetical protein
MSLSDESVAELKKDGAAHIINKGDGFVNKAMAALAQVLECNVASD